jgi:hypothetical protein
MLDRIGPRDWHQGASVPVQPINLPVQKEKGNAKVYRTQNPKLLFDEVSSNH